MPPRSRPPSVGRGRAANGGGVEAQTPSQARRHGGSTPSQARRNGGNAPAQTPSHARASSVPKRPQNGSGEEDDTPSYARGRSAAEAQMPSQARRNGGGNTPSQARRNGSGNTLSQARAVSVPKEPSPTGSEEEDDTPSRARGRTPEAHPSPKIVDGDQYDEDGGRSPAEARTPPDVVDDDGYDEGGYDVDEQGNAEMDGMRVDRRQWQGDNESADAAATKEKGRSKPSPVRPPRSKSAARPTQRTSSARRSGSVARPRRGTTRSPKDGPNKRNAKTSEEENEWRAFEEWKRKEGEQRALIKNMRKRQEVALREAEGERERVSSALRYSFVAPMFPCAKPCQMS